MVDLDDKYLYLPKQYQAKHDIWGQSENPVGMLNLHS